MHCDTPCPAIADKQPHCITKVSTLKFLKEFQKNIRNGHGNQTITKLRPSHLLFNRNIYSRSKKFGANISLFNILTSEPCYSDITRDYIPTRCYVCMMDSMFISRYRLYACRDWNSIGRGCSGCCHRTAA